MRLGGLHVVLDGLEEDDLFLLPGVETFFLDYPAHSLVSKLMAGPA
jgi:hypothetical protein